MAVRNKVWVAGDLNLSFWEAQRVRERLWPRDVWRRLVERWCERVWSKAGW